MRLRTARSDAGQEGSESGAEARRRRDGRGLGPFSGGQLTAIIITVVAAVGFPVGAFAAVKFTNVSITDPHGVYRAAVSSAGQLQVHPNGTQTVAGSVTATPAAPSALFAKETDVNNATCTAVASAPMGKALILTSVHVDLPDPAVPSPTYPTYYALYAGASCPGTNVTVDIGTFTSSVHTLVLPFPSGLALKAGSSLWMYSPFSTEVSVSGYSVPATACTTGCL